MSNDFTSLCVETSQHKFAKSSRSAMLRFCTLCGAIEYKKSVAVKPDEYKTSCDIDGMEDFFNKMKNEVKLTIDYENESHLEYSQNREFILKSLKTLFNKFSFRDSVFFLAVQYLDIILLSQPNFNYDLAIYTCFLLASKIILTLGKFYENDPKLPKMKQIANSIEGDHQDKDIKASEVFCLKLLSYKLNLTTSFDFLEVLLKNGIVFEHELRSDEIMKQIYDFTIFINKQFISDVRYVDFSPLHVACASVAFARKKFKLNSWSKHFEEIYGIRKEDFMNCFLVISTLFSRQPFNFTNEKTKASPIILINSELISPIHQVKYCPVPALNNLNFNEEDARTPNNVFSQKKVVTYNHLLTHFSHNTNEDMNSTMDEENFFSFSDYQKARQMAFTSELNTSNKRICFNDKKKLNMTNVNKQCHSGFNSQISPFNLENILVNRDDYEVFNYNLNNNPNNNLNNVYNYLFQ